MTYIISPTKEPADILEAAIQNIKKNGWCKGKYSDYNGAVCMLGAINVSIDGNPDGWRVNNKKDTLRRSIAENYIRPLLDTPNTGIPYFNDNSTTTREDVINILRKAAALARVKDETNSDLSSRS